MTHVAIPIAPLTWGAEAGAMSGISQSSLDRAMRVDVVTYFVRAAIGGPIKIGRSRNLQSRLRDLRNSSPIELVCLGWIAGNFEADLHSKFKTTRLHGEWFEATPALLRIIERHAIQN